MKIAGDHHGGQGQAKCPCCGEAVKSTWKVCPMCEVPLARLTCPACGIPVQDNWKLCPECSTRLICPACGRRLPGGPSKCTMCGQGKEEASAAHAILIEPVTGIELVHVPAGSFHMGDLFEVGWDDETPTREVRVESFHLGKYPVTQGQWGKVTFIQYGMAAGIQAIRDSGIEVTDANAERIGINIGSGIGGLPLIEETHALLMESGPRKISPFFIPGSIVNMISGNLSIQYGIKGPNLAVVTACTTGLHAIGLSARMIAYGDADVMVAGGSECATSQLGVGGFASARALSTRNDDPATASRPWDKDRDGFVLGDGAGVLVLEEYEHARRRGAKHSQSVIRLDTLLQ